MADLANTRRPDNIGALTIDRIWGAIARTSSTTGDRVEPPVEGWDHPVVAGGFPVEDIVGHERDVAVVARDAEGREVVRNTSSPGTDG